ncbi:MAG: hypothetical protein V3T72_17695 [Thermoanaerobaculia bacterium]
MTGLPQTVRREIDDLPRHYEIQHQVVRERVILTARVRGVPVMLYLDAAEYPFTPPEMELVSGWSWPPADGQQIRCLECQRRWNRTLGISALLRELRQRFGEEPPKIRRRPARRSILQAVFGWLRKLRQRLRRKPDLERPAAAAPDALRERYDSLIRDNTERVRRYQQAVAQLTTQWRHKAARLEGLRGEIHELKKRESATLEEARQTVDELQAAGKSAAEIKANAGYQRIQSAYEECAADLAELEERADELEADAEKHLDKIRRHETQLEELMGELEDLKDEAAEVITDMTLVQLDKEIVDVRAGISHAELAEELGELRRKLRKERAIVRVTREATENGDADELYLEVTEKVSAARELERTLGLEEAPPRPLDPER